MKTENYIEFAIKKLNCSQKDLAKKIGVSPTQISKWKQGEHMSYDTQTKFQKLCEIDDMQGASPEEIILFDCNSVHNPAAVFNLTCFVHYAEIIP